MRKTGLWLLAAAVLGLGLPALLGGGPAGTLIATGRGGQLAILAAVGALDVAAIPLLARQLHANPSAQGPSASLALYGLAMTPALVSLVCSLIAEPGAPGTPRLDAVNGLLTLLSWAGVVLAARYAGEDRTA